MAKGKYKFAVGDIVCVPTMPHFPKGEVLGGQPPDYYIDFQMTGWHLQAWLAEEDLELAKE